MIRAGSHAAGQGLGEHVRGGGPELAAEQADAGETHHRVYRIVDGADDDWASWYAQWLIDLSELPDLLGAGPVRSELVYLLVSLVRQHPIGF